MRERHAPHSAHTSIDPSLTIYRSRPSNPCRMFATGVPSMVLGSISGGSIAPAVDNTSAAKLFGFLAAHAVAATQCIPVRANIANP